MSRVGNNVTLYADILGVQTEIGFQRDVTFNENVAEIDVSSKEQRERRVLGGRYSSDVTLDALYVHDDPAYVALVAAMRAGTLIEIERTEVAGIGTLTADALVTSISNRFPDQAESTISVSLVIDGAWTP